MRKLIAGTVIAVIILAWLISRIDLKSLGGALLGVNRPLFAGALGIHLAVMYIKARRWALAIDGRFRYPPPRRLFAACMIGFAGNVVMPARLGELARVLVFCKHQPMSRSHALTSVAVTQLFDLLVLALYFLVVSFWAAGTQLVDRRILVILVLAVLAVLVILAVLQWNLEWVRSMLSVAGGRAPASLRNRLHAYVDGLGAGLKVIGQPLAVVAMSLVTMLIWSLETVAMVLALAAFGITLNPLMPPLMVVALNLAFAVPLTPGNVGTHQLISVLILSLFSVTKVDALAFSIGYQGAISLTIVLAGAAFLYREGISPRVLYTEAGALSGTKNTPAKVVLDHENNSVS